jgi:DGQHR domain-containing protein
MPKPSTTKTAFADRLSVRAVRTRQGDKVDVFAFFVRGADVLRIAEISRIERDDFDALKGFQRGEIKNHVKSIIEFLNNGNVLFPNAIILAFSPDVSFKLSRGPAPGGTLDIAQGGILTIPMRPDGRKCAWIVDGQQRSLALSRSKNKDLPVPVIGFVANDVGTQREQFILVNKAKPLPSRLINELLPEVSIQLPRDLAARKLPSELCASLNRDPKSPFHRLVRRESDTHDGAIVVDSALIEAIKRNLKPPLGALSMFRNGAEDDPTNAYRLLLGYWTEVKSAFPRAWGQPPTVSRLMHSAGIRVMGALMDSIMLRADSTTNPASEIRSSLQRLAPHCAWTEGTWDELGWKWNDVQSTSSHIAKLTDHLIQLDRVLARRLQK